MFPSLAMPKIVSRLHGLRRTERPVNELAPEDESRRALIRSLVFENPSAFSSDLDVQSMMSVYGHRL